MFWGHQKPLRNGDAHSLGFPHKNTFCLRKHPGACFWGHKKTLREWPHALPGFGQVPVSNPGLEPGASGVCRPCAKPLGKTRLPLFLPSPAKSRAKFYPSPDKSAKNGNLRFPTHSRDLSAKLGGNEVYGRRASFWMGLTHSKYPPQDRKHV